MKVDTQQENYEINDDIGLSFSEKSLIELEDGD